MKKHNGNQSWLDKLRKIVAPAAAPPGSQAEVAQSATIECCSDQVNIAYRGVSDDRLYVAYGRRSVDIKFFKPRGLKVFCAACRKRLL
jgi:hypothetical protein